MLLAEGGRQDLPSKETLDAVEGYTLLRADHNGWIQLMTDGEHMWVEVERKILGYIHFFTIGIFLLNTLQICTHA